jgi:hypothetical protein
LEQLKLLNCDRAKRTQILSQGAIALITRLLNRRFGHPISEEVRPLRYLLRSARLSTLSLPVLEDLSEALLDFSTTLAVSPKERADLEAWLAERA